VVDVEEERVAAWSLTKRPSCRRRDTRLAKRSERAPVVAEE
jgi:hypothetical protein